MSRGRRGEGMGVGSPVLRPRAAGLVVSPSHSITTPRSCSRSRSLSLARSLPPSLPPSLPFTFLPFLSCVPPLLCPPLLPRSSLPYPRLHLGHGAQEPLLAAGPDPREELPQPAAALPVPCLSPFRRRWHGPARCSRDTVVAIPAAARASQPSFGRLGAWTEGGGGGGKGGGGQSVCPCQTVRRERLRIGQAARHGCREGKWVRAARLLDRRCSRGTPPPALSGRGSHSNRHGVIKAYEEEVNQHFEEFEDPRCPSNQAIAAG